MFGSTPGGTEGTVIRIVKLSDDRAEEMIVCSETFEGVLSHYTHRSVLCGGKDCPLCYEGRPTRFLGFVVVQWRLGIGLLRLTSIPATRLMAFDPKPGMVMTVVQKNRRSAVQIARGGYASVKPKKVVTQLELLNCLSHLFGVGSVDFNDTYEANVESLRVLACKMAARERLEFSS